MGLLDKAMKAATTAKGQLDEVREVRAQAAIRPVEPAALTEHEEHVLERLRTIGAPDPRLLLTAAEASEAAGQPLGGPHLIYGDDYAGVRYEAAGPGRHWRVSVSAFHATERGQHFDAGVHWFGHLADVVADDGIEVAGLGDVAVQREGDLFVLADPLLLMVEAATPAGGAADAQRMQQVARAVIGRLLG